MFTFFLNHFKDNIPIKHGFIRLRLKMNFDRDFMLKMMQRRKLRILGNIQPDTRAITLYILHIICTYYYHVYIY